nr:AAA family ATPase [Candidatus Sigynarchaeota archaeon]
MAYPSLEPFQTCIILCGLPASGKTTLASALVLKLRESGLTPKTASAVDIDVIRLDVYRQASLETTFSPEHETRVRDAKRQAIRRLLEDGSSAIDDDMNYFRSMRHEIALLCASLRVHYLIVHVSTPLKKCLEWNRDPRRSPPVPDNLIVTLDGRLDKPGSRKYTWDVPIYSCNLAKTSIPRAVDEIAGKLVEAAFLLKSKVSITAMFEGSVTSVLENPAYWNLACLKDIINKGYLINDVQEWREIISTSMSGKKQTAVSILEQFDMETRRMTSAHVAGTGPIQVDVLERSKEVKARAMKALKRDPS